MLKDWLVLSSVAFGVGFSLSLPLTRTVKTSALVGLATIPSAAAGALVVERQRQKRTMPSATASAALTTDLETLERRKQDLQDSIATLRDRQTAAESTCQDLDEKIQALETQLAADEQHKQTIDQQIEALKAQQKRAEDDCLATSLASQRIQQELVGLESQKSDLTGEIAVLNEQHATLARQEEKAQASLEAIATQQAEQNQAFEQQQQKTQRLQLELTALIKQRDLLQEAADSATKKVQDLKHEASGIDAYIEQQWTQRRAIEAEISMLNEQLQQSQRQYGSITRDVEDLTSRKDELERFISNVQGNPPSIPGRGRPPVDRPTQPSSQEEQPDAGRVNTVAPEHTIETVEPVPVVPAPERRRPFRFPFSSRTLLLSNVEHCEWLWEDMIRPRWRHPDFLGSICLPRKDQEDVWGTETLLNIVGRNLKYLGTNNLKLHRFHERFGDSRNKYWLKIMTLALSEHAYYVEAEERFWQGLCQHLDLPYRNDNSDPVPSLRALAAEGITLLNLPKAVDGYPVVSTLWLQNGIPYRNLEHFADLVAELSREFGWQYLLDTRERSLAETLYDTCQRRYPGRTVMQRFLEYSCRPTSEPISGQILQSTAGVAIALRQYKLRPQDVLLNSAQRQEFLLDKVPDFNFFLRDWEALTKILDSCSSD